MTLTKQQKLDMIRDVELSIAKEELAEAHIKNMAELEKSDHPMRTLKDIITKTAPAIQEISIAEKESVTNQKGNAIALEVTQDIKPQTHSLTAKEAETLEQSEIATKTPSTKEGLDSKSQWRFTGLESVAARENAPAETSQNNVTQEQIQEFRQEYYSGQYNALEKLNQLNTENGYVTEQQLDQFIQDIVDNQRVSQEILSNYSGDAATKAEAEQSIDFDLQEHFENAKSMSIDNDMAMER